MIKVLSIITCVGAVSIAGCAFQEDADEDLTGPNDTGSVNQALALNCVNTPGRPDGLPGDIDEVYHPGAMNALLSKDRILRERFGKATVNSCADARALMAAYRNESVRIATERVATAQAIPTGTAKPASEDYSGTVDGGEQTEKIFSGYDGVYPFTVRIVYTATINGVPQSTYCSAVLVSKDALLTSAHCIPTNGYYLVSIQQQQVSGAAPTVLFGGTSKWLTFTKHPSYLGAGHVDADLAVGKFYYATDSFGTSSLTRIWMDNIALGTTDFMMGYGSTYTGEYTGGHLHVGTGRIDGVYDYQTWTFADTSPPRTTCPGDSGGSHGTWHGGYHMLYAVNSSGGCGEIQSYFSIGTRMRYNMAFVESIIGTCSTYTIDGQYYKRCW